MTTPSIQVGFVYARSIYVCFPGDTFTPLLPCGLIRFRDPPCTFYASGYAPSTSPLVLASVPRQGGLPGHTLSNYSGVNILSCYRVMCHHPFFFEYTHASRGVMTLGCRLARPRLYRPWLKKESCYSPLRDANTRSRGYEISQLPSVALTPVPYSPSRLTRAPLLALSLLPTPGGSSALQLPCALAINCTASLLVPIAIGPLLSVLPQSLLRAQSILCFPEGGSGSTGGMLHTCE